MTSFRTVTKRLAGVMLCLACGASADGFRNPPATAAALGKAGKCIVWVDDASAVFYNPANLDDVSARQLQLSGVVGYSGAEYSGALGETETDAPWSVLPALALAWPLSPQDLSLGLGVQVPYGRQTQWDEQGLFRYSAPVQTEMSVVDITPALSWRALDCLALGAGLDVYYGQLGFRQYLPWPSALGGGEGEARAEAEGWGLGANLGITWRLTERQRLALTYRTPFDIDFEGDLDVRGASPPLLASGLVAAQSDLSTTFAFPTIVALGYGLQVSECLRVEADVEWLEFSRYETMDLDAGANNTLIQGVGMSSTPQNWDDTWTAGLSAEWRFAKCWTLRSGYVYLDSPIPDSTFSPAVLDQCQSVVSMGLGFHSGRHRVDLAYAMGLFSTREVRGNQNPAYDGDYDLDAQLGALTYTIAF
jgi:long-chain fatty acid transport protein